MSERIVSPGVFTRENDLSFLAQGIGEIGGAFIGPTPKGPAFIPTVVESQQEYVTRFGDADTTHYTGIAVKNYLREAGVATVVRVLGLDGYSGSVNTSALLYVTSSGEEKLLAIVHPSTIGQSITTFTATGTTSSFALTLTSSNANGNVSATGLTTASADSKYFVNLLGTTPETKAGGYFYSVFPEALNLPGILGVSASLSTTAIDFSTRGYTNASTPWIQSQPLVSGSVDLFRLHTLSDGVAANKEIKVSILAVKPTFDAEVTPYGTFSLLVRKYDDTDTRTQILEQYENLTLDPNSPRYIARVIGNSTPTEDVVTGEVYYQGDFPNKSEYIRVEMFAEDLPAEALPMGFGPVKFPAVIPSAQVVSASYVTSRWSTPNYSATSLDTKAYYGWSFGAATEGYLAPIPTGAPPVTASFNLLDAALDQQVPSGSSGVPITLNNPEHLTYRRFSVPFQGGFDGMNPAVKKALGSDIAANNSQGFNLSTKTSSGTRAYTKALNAISNPDNFDFNLLVTPGVIRELHPLVTQEALDLCETRGDAFYIMDTTRLDAAISTATAESVDVNSSYAATYYPWVRILDTNSNKLAWVPPSVVMPEVYAFNDNAAAEWFAPAGLNRGGIPGAVGVKTRVPQTSRDTLYEAKVNPIVQFPGQGIVAWGQKTLQTQASALDRVNVRRLLIAVKKFIASSARYLVFEQNVEATRNRFLNIVNPYLASVQERSGLFAFRVVMDDTNNTPDLIDRNILYGQIYLQPTRTAEFIILDFNVLPTGAAFPTA